MKFYMAAGRLVGTQAEAKAIDRGWGEHHVPVDKDGLMEYVNNLLEQVDHKGNAAPPPAPPTATTNEQSDDAPMRPSQMERFEAVARKLGWAPPGNQPATKPTEGQKRELVEEILELEGSALNNVLSAAIGRLHEVSGTHGWAAFGKNVYQYGHSSMSVERGLGMLMLAALNVAEPK